MALVPQISRLVQEIDPNLPITGVTTVEALGMGRTSDTRAIMGLLSIFALMALVLAASGTYGIVAFGVTQKRKELGLRIALGARNEQVVRLVVAQGIRVVLAGLVVGLLSAWALSRILTNMLFEVSATDPLAYMSSAAVLLTVALVASWLPARRATGVDPMVVLKSD